VSLEVASRSGIPDFPQIIEDDPKQRWSMFRQISVDGTQGRVHVVDGLLGVEQIGVNDFEERRIELHGLWNHLAIRKAARA
jgi:hypothetical protein